MILNDGKCGKKDGKMGRCSWMRNVFMKDQQVYCISCYTNVIGYRVACLSILVTDLSSIILQG